MAGLQGQSGQLEDAILEVLKGFVEKLRPRINYEQLYTCITLTSIWTVVYTMRRLYDEVDFGLVVALVRLAPGDSLPCKLLIITRV